MNSIGLISEDLHAYTFDIKGNFSFNFYFHTYARLGISNRLVVIKRFMKDLNNE